MSILPLDEDYVFRRHDKNLFNISPNSKIDSLNSIIKSFSIHHHLYFIDINSQIRNETMSFKDANSLLINSKNYTVDDGVHPTAIGYHKIGVHVYSQLMEMGLLKRKMRIVCFGDSITYGAFMEGMGTSTGNTYPSILSKLLNKNFTL